MPMRDMMGSMSKRNLLICFDAFGTLFKPKRPIQQQYGDVARSLGLSGFSDDDVQESFQKAFKKESKQHPNYGRAAGLGAERWWTNIIENTFKPLIPPDQNLPSSLVPKLLHRFWSDEGYVLFSDVPPLLKKIRGHAKSSGGHVVIGVITNSDDRVPAILQSLGIRVSSLRYGSKAGEAPAREDAEVDFSVMSYDVGHEKPDGRIFDAAAQMLEIIVNASNGFSDALPAVSEWQKVYVGDEYDKDIKGALEAGWCGVLIDRESSGQRNDLPWLDEQAPGTLFEAFNETQAIGFTSMANLAKRIPE